MLRSVRDLERYRVVAQDGDVGRVSDFFFEDEHWAIRHLVVETGGAWDGAHRVLVSPSDFRHADWETRIFHLALTRDDVRRSPAVELAQPLSRRYKQDRSRYYAWPYYWGYAENWNTETDFLLGYRAGSEPEGDQTPAGDPHLRSTKTVLGFHVQATDDAMGRVVDLMIDEAIWTIRFLLVETQERWFGKKVLVDACWTQQISEESRKFHLNLSREAIRSCPEWQRGTHGVAA